MVGNIRTNGGAQSKERKAHQGTVYGSQFTVHSSQQPCKQWKPSRNVPTRSTRQVDRLSFGFGFGFGFPPLVSGPIS